MCVCVCMCVYIYVFIYIISLDEAGAWNQRVTFFIFLKKQARRISVSWDTEAEQAMAARPIEIEVYGCSYLLTYADVC